MSLSTPPELAAEANFLLCSMDDKLLSLISTPGDSEVSVSSSWLTRVTELMKAIGPALLTSASQQLWLASIQHSPDETAIGAGATSELAASALCLSYPRAAGHMVEVVRVQSGTHLNSLSGDNASSIIAIP